MSPSVVHQNTPQGSFEDDIDLFIVGLGVEYPPNRVGPDALETLAERFYPPSEA